MFSSNNIIAAKSGLKLWGCSVVPSLFPFFVATELLSHTQISFIFGKFFKPIMKPLFNISGEGSFAWFMGWISGYPVGAKIAVHLRKNNICTKEECERLLSFTNNSGPLFIVGTVGISLLGSSTLGILLFISHILGSLTVGIVFRYWKKNKQFEEKNSYTSINDNKLINVNFLNIGEILSNSISSATSTIFMIGGFIVFFSIIISILNTSGIIHLINLFFEPVCRNLNLPSSIVGSLFSGIVEVTNGVNLLSSIKLKHISIVLILISFILGLGGVCVFLQILSVVAKSDLSIKPYILGKILHSFFASLYTFLLIQIFPFFNFNLC